MIKYALKCSQDHHFDSWFKSGGAFAKLKAAGHVGCPICGTTKVSKAIMTPGVTPSRNKGSAPIQTDKPAGDMHALTAPASPAQDAIDELKKKIQEHSEYVGNDFVAEARAIHDGDAPERSIYGEAEASEAKKLLDDGVPVAPLPFVPTRKTN